MLIEEIENKKVKISPHSITVRNEKNKTIGVVRNLRHFSELPTWQQLNFFKSLKQAGVWGSEYSLMKNVLFQGDQMYYLHDLRLEEVYEQFYQESAEQWPNETRRYLAQKEAAEKMAAFCPVLSCYIVS